MKLLMSVSKSFYCVLLLLFNDSSSARIVEAYLDPFEALSTTGLLSVYVQNTGELTSTYTIAVSHCSVGIDWVQPQSVTLDPGEEKNLTFVIHSFYSIGQINHCEGRCFNHTGILPSFHRRKTYAISVELIDAEAKVMDNLTINFQTTDTCFCHGYCGCSVSLCVLQ